MLANEEGDYIVNKNLYRCGHWHSLSPWPAHKYPCGEFRKGEKTTIRTRKTGVYSSVSYESI